MLSLIIIIILTLLIIYVFMKQYKEKFTDKQARIALYNNPSSCPFEYITLYEDPDNNNKFIVKTKLKGEPKSLDMVFDSIENFLDYWDQISEIFPNLNKCTHPYKSYLNNIKDNYQKKKHIPYTKETTIPIYYETFNGTKRIDVPSIYLPNNIEVRKLTRTSDNPTQLGTNRYMTPNTFTMRGNEQIDTSVQPHNDYLPSTYTDKNIQLMKNQLLDSEFERQHVTKKYIRQMNIEIQQLRIEIEKIREENLNNKVSKI